jgi:hypothetical protein
MSPVAHEITEEWGESMVKVGRRNARSYFRKKLEEGMAHSPLRVLLHLHNTLEKRRVQELGPANSE